MTLEQLLTQGSKQLEEAGVPEAGLNAWYLLQACMGAGDFSFRRSDYFLQRTEEAEVQVEKKYWSYIEMRKGRMPLEYITGVTEFMGLPFRVDENVLIPRQDTETVVEYVCPMCREKRVLDLCTGSGCIGLSIGALAKPSSLMLSDISREALLVAQTNLVQFRKLAMLDEQLEVQLVCGDLFESVEGVFDVIISNPPYIESEVIFSLMPEVRDYEPAGALDGGADGLVIYRRIVEESPEYLNKHGMLCVEIGYNQGRQVSELMQKRGFSSIEVRKDLAGNARMVSGIWL